MIRSHARAYHALHSVARTQGRDIRIGLAHHLRHFQPAQFWNPLDRWATKIMEDLGNWSIVDALRTGKVRVSIPFILNHQEEIPEARGTQDFIGINYYTRGLVRLNLKSSSLIEQVTPKNAKKNDLGWEIYPKGLYSVLRKTHQRFPDLPILITENGTADHEDRFRSEFLIDHLFWIKKALDDQIPVETYCHWSFLDNYEWADGFEPRFGLYEVNYSTLERTLRPSGRLFSQIARRSVVPSKNSFR